MGEEDFFIQNKTRTFNAICSGSHGELMKISMKDFKLIVMNNEDSRSYVLNRYENKA